MKPLTTLFRPRVEHPDPKIRCRAIAALPADDERLIQAALTDADAEVRRTALFGVADLGVLQGCAAQDGDPSVREHAGEQLLKRLCGQSRYDYSQQDRLTAVGRINDPALLAAVAIDAEDPKIRLSAVHGLDEPALLLKMACDDAAADVRLAAAEKITDPEALKRLQSASRNHDNRLYRLVTDRLAKQREAQRRASQRLELLAQIEQVASLPASNASAARLDRVLREWHQGQLSVGADDQILDRVESLRTDFGDRLNDYRKALATREAKQQSLAALAQTLAVQPAGQAPIDALHAELSKQEADYRSLAPLDDTQARRLDRQFDDQARQLESQLRERQRDVERSARLEAFWQLLKQAIETSDLPHRRQIEALQQQLDELDYPITHSDGSDRLATRQRSTDLMGQLRARLDGQRRKEAKDQARAAIEALAAQIGAGTLDAAIPLRELAVQAVRDSHDLDSGTRERLGADLEKQEQALRELQDWNRWGADQAREALCVEAEALVERDASSLGERAKKVQSLRSRWQAIDKRLSRVNKPLWERFDSACTAAFEPVVTDREQQKQKQAENKLAREAFCERVAQFERDIDWADIDWRKLDAQIHNLKNEWRKLGGVRPSVWKQLDKTFRATLKPVEQRQAEMFVQSRDQRERLIRLVTGLVEFPELSKAIERTLEAQQEWKAALPLPRREEQKLWKQFRRACDAVFARRKAANEAQQQQLDAERANCDGLIRQLREGLTEAFDADSWQRLADDLEAAMRQLAPRHANDLRKRLKGLYRQRDDHQRTLRASHQAQQAAADRAGQLVCRELESQLEAQSEQSDNAVADWQQRWDTACADSKPLRRRLGHRFEQALACIHTPARAERWRASLPAALAEREQLLLDMEIIASLPTPESHQSQRAERQIALLSELMGTPEAQRQHRLKALYDEYWKAGAIAAEHWPSLDNRLDLIQSTALKKCH